MPAEWKLPKMFAGLKMYCFCAPNLPTKVYIGFTEKDLKTRWNDHKLSLTNKKYRNSTSLSTYVWSLKEKYDVTPMLRLVN